LLQKGIESPESAATQIANEIIIKGRLSNYSLLDFKYRAKKNLEQGRNKEAILFDTLLYALSQTGFARGSTVLTAFSKEKRLFAIFADDQNILTPIMDPKTSYGFHDSNMASEMLIESREYFTPNIKLEIKVYNPEKRVWIPIPISIRYRAEGSDQGPPSRKTTTE